MSVQLYTVTKFMQEFVQDGRAWPVEGLSGIVAEARKQGARVYVDFLAGPDEVYEVNSKNVRAAVNEVEECFVRIHWKDGAKDWMYVIPSNDEDWLCDYTYNNRMERLIEGHIPDDIG